MVKKILFSSLFTLLIIGCTEKAPTKKDGKFDLDITVKNGENILPGMPVEISTLDYVFEEQVDTTDSLGKVCFEDISYAAYHVSSTAEYKIQSEDDPNATNTVNFDGDSIFYPGENILYTNRSNLNPGIKINEIYSAGPVNNIHYFFDQFIELYNSSYDTLYLDGMVFCRMYEFLEDITFIFQFPGEPMGGTSDYPIYPGEFKVIATNAINHRDLVFSGEKSLDLSNADFEFKNSRYIADSDNPDVPNLENLEDGYNRDFLMALNSDVIILADGSDLNYLDGLDSASVIDGVEYHHSTDHEKDIEDFVDRGWAGVGLERYSGKSIERISKGYDTNNSTLNFQILDEPTPGYQHE